MEKDVKIVDFSSTKEYGQMSLKFIDKNLSEEERLEKLHVNKERIASEIGLTYKQIFGPIQKSRVNPYPYEDGYCYTLTQEEIDAYDDLFDLKVYADIVKLDSHTKNVALAFPPADCAIVKAINFKTREIVLSHCGGEYIDRYLPMQTIDALGGNEKDIVVYVSPFAHSLFYANANNLVWANNPEVWKDCKEETTTNGELSVRINILKALKNQLLERKIPYDNTHMSEYDVTKTNLFYSNSRSYIDPSYGGRFLTGIAVVDSDKKIKTNELIKIIK